LDQKNLVEDTQDYTITDPADVLYPIRAEIRKATQRNQTTHLTVVSTLPSQSAQKGEPRDVALTTATNLRLRPVPLGLEPGDTGRLFTWYKEKNVEIVESGASGSLQKNDDDAAALAFPDEWFWVYQDWVLYYAWKLSGDPRAGEVRTDGGGSAQYNGQLAEAIDAIVQMARKEKVFLDDIGQGVNG